MSARTLDDLITDGGIRSTYFFNGRLLSGEDLRQEQDANRFSRRELGKALGSGIAQGFEVTQQAANLNSAILTIAPGLAINLLGQAIQLNVRVDLSLLSPQTQTSQGVAAFSDCLRPANGVYVISSGVYLLAVCPVAVKQGRAPTSGLGNESSPCNSNVVVDGFQFLLVSIPSSLLPALDALTRRNLVAWRCFGLGEWSASPFGAQPATIGLVEALRAAGLLHDCDVPLAIFSWLDTAQIQDLDIWSVRRRITAPWPDLSLRSTLSDTRRSTAEASTLQFQTHLASLVQAGSAPSQSLRYLPPAGYLPASVDPRGLLGACWNGVVTPMSQGIYREIFFEALLEDPIDLQNPVPVRVYQQSSTDGFVLFARTRDARLRISYASSVPSSAVATLKSLVSNFTVTLQFSAAGYPLSGDVPAGRYNLEVAAPDFASYESGDLSLVGGEIFSLDAISLSSTATGSLLIQLDGSVKLTAFEAVAVTVVGEDGAGHAVVRSGNSWIAANLPAADYTVRVSISLLAVSFVNFSNLVAERKTAVAAGPPTIVRFVASEFGQAVNRPLGRLVR